jgi:Flp pilus assembly protein TadD
LAQAYAAGGRFQDAIREYRAVLQLDPNNARARADLQGLNASEK